MLPKVVYIGSALGLLASISIGPIAGVLYRVHPRLPFYVILANQVLIALLFANLHWASQKGDCQSPLQGKHNEM